MNINVNTLIEINSQKSDKRVIEKDNKFSFEIFEVKNNKVLFSSEKFNSYLEAEKNSEIVFNNIQKLKCYSKVSEFLRKINFNPNILTFLGNESIKKTPPNQIIALCKHKFRIDLPIQFFMNPEF